MAGGRAFRSSAPRRAAFAALLTLLLLAFLSFLLSSSSPTAPSRSAPASPPSRLAAIRRHAADHAAVLAAYASHARKLKEASAAQSLSFSTLSSDLSALSSRLALHLSLPEDALKPLEKEARDRIKLARLLAADAKEGFDTQSKIQKLSDTVFAVGEQLARARRAGRMSSRIAAGSTPKSLHCLAMRLLEARLAEPSDFADDQDPSPEFDDPSLYHYAVFSDNVLAVSVVVASAARAAVDPSHHVFHVVTAPMYLPAFSVWFARRAPPLGVHVQLLTYSDFPFLNASFSPVLRQIEAGKRDVALLDYLRFYLPDMFPALRRVVLLEDDVVVQKDLAGLWHVDLDGKVNGAVEMCFGGFRRYRKYLNFTQAIVRERFNPGACAWAYGVNVFDLQAWRQDGCTELFHQYMEMNEDGDLWDPTSILPAGLMAFYGNTKPLDKSWHVMGLGYNPSISPEVIRGAAVIHFNGNMKPWLDVALNQYKALWTKLKLKAVYMYVAGFYTYSIFALLFWETRRSDFGISMTHHVATVFLIALSYIFRFARVGSVVLAIHDASDVFLELGKISKYSGRQLLADVSFLLFVSSWIVLRLIYFPFWILWSTSYEVVLTLDKEKHKFDGPIYYYVFNSLLFSLLVLHLHWWVLMYRMLMRQIQSRGHVGDDIRSDSEGEEEHED